MNYCDDCILADICGCEGYSEDFVTFCSYKDKFIPKSVLEDIKKELLDNIRADTVETWDTLTSCISIINCHINGKENTNG